MFGKTQHKNLGHQRFRINSVSTPLARPRKHPPGLVVLSRASFIDSALNSYLSAPGVLHIHGSELSEQVPCTFDLDTP